MYQPPHFRETDLPTQQAFVAAHPLGLLISGGPDGILANPIPFVLYAGEGPLGTLRAHLSRGNPQWQALAAAPEALVVFQGAEHYITPSWYPQKAVDGKVVPTWNYAIVQARGPARVIEDAAWLRTQIEALTRSQEGQRAAPWAVDDAPADFIASQIKGIIGIEIEIAEIDGKWKVSQNRPEADRKGVVRGLEDSNGAADTAEMAELVRRYGKLD